MLLDVTSAAPPDMGSTASVPSAPGPAAAPAPVAPPPAAEIDEMETDAETGRVTAAMQLSTRYLWAGRKLIGKGQHGLVFLCPVRRDAAAAPLPAALPARAGSVAIKSVRKPDVVAGADSGASLAFLRHEATVMRALAAAAGPDGACACPRLYEVVEDDESIHFVMEAALGGSLQDVISKMGLPVPEHIAAQVFRAAVRAVQLCHSAGVMHRDIKPHNFVLTSNLVDRDCEMRLADFDLSTFVAPGERLRERVGSPYYLAPEVLLQNYSLEADVWSLGVLLHLLLVGYHRFDGADVQAIFRALMHQRLAVDPSPGSAWARVSPAARDLVKRMMERKVTARATLEEVLAHPWLQVRRPSVVRSVSPTAFSLRLSVAAAAAAQLAAAVPGGGAVSMVGAGAAAPAAPAARAPASSNLMRLQSADWAPTREAAAAPADSACGSAAPAGRPDGEGAAAAATAAAANGPPGRAASGDLDPARRAKQCKMSTRPDLDLDAWPGEWVHAVRTNRVCSSSDSNSVPCHPIKHASAEGPLGTGARAAGGGAGSGSSAPTQPPSPGTPSPHAAGFLPPRGLHTHPSHGAGGSFNLRGSPRGRSSPLGMSPTASAAHGTGMQASAHQLTAAAARPAGAGVWTSDADCDFATARLELAAAASSVASSGPPARDVGEVGRANHHSSSDGFERHAQTPSDCDRVDRDLGLLPIHRLQEQMGMMRAL